jgi:hypothetical protein
LQEKKGMETFSRNVLNSNILGKENVSKDTRPMTTIIATVRIRCFA